LGQKLEVDDFLRDVGDKEDESRWNDQFGNYKVDISTQRWLEGQSHVLESTREMREDSQQEYLV